MDTLTPAQRADFAEDLALLKEVRDHIAGLATLLNTALGLLGEVAALEQVHETLCTCGNRRSDMDGHMDHCLYRRVRRFNETGGA